MAIRSKLLLATSALLLCTVSAYSDDANPVPQENPATKTESAPVAAEVEFTSEPIDADQAHLQATKEQSLQKYPEAVDSVPDASALENQDINYATPLTSNTSPSSPTAITEASPVFIRNEDASLNHHQALPNALPDPLKPSAELGETASTPNVDQITSLPIIESPDPLIRAAAVYGTYHQQVGELQKTGFKSASDVEVALTTLGGQNPGQLSEGWFAYAALVASQSPEFRHGVRNFFAAGDRDILLSYVAQDASYIRTYAPGSANAIDAALGATQADSNRLRKSAAYFYEQGYTLTKYGWAKSRYPGGKMNSVIAQLNISANEERTPRSSIVTAFSSPGIDSPLQQAGFTGAQSLWDSAVGASSGALFTDLTTQDLTNYRLPAQKIDTVHTPILINSDYTANLITTLAAYRVLGLNDVPQASVDQVLTYTSADQNPIRTCLRKNNLQSNVCIEATANPSETTFCIGLYLVAGVSDCFSAAAQAQ